jgi:hypothetical protein
MMMGYTLDGTASVNTWSVLGAGEGGGHLTGSNPTTYHDGTGPIANLAATPGPDQFVFTSATTGIHTITGFNPTQDTLALSAAAFPSYAEVQAHETSYQGGTFIGLSNNSALVIQGVLPDQLTAGNFVLR